MNILATYRKRTIETAPLAVFRFLFGIMMLLGIIRFWAYGWIEKLYLEPKLHFTYHGFEWVRPLGSWTYLLFIVCGLAALGVALGYRYRLSAILFFLSFTYIELMDKTTYLNHYYFVSCVAFMLIFIPAHTRFSMDVVLGRVAERLRTRAFYVHAIQALLFIVYFYAGLAKLNSDWLLNAMPLAIWLPASYDLPIVGNLLQERWLHFAFAWGGAGYDLLIPFFLLMARTRFWAYLLVIVFHVLTWILFPIGMFPFIMIVSALIFFSGPFHENLLTRVTAVLQRIGLSTITPQRTGSRRHNSTRSARTQSGSIAADALQMHTASEEKSDGQSAQRNLKNPTRHRLAFAVLSIFIVFQAVIPFRHLLYPGELFWTEQGYRFSWRVMLIEKTGYSQFKVVQEDGTRFYVQNDEFLTPFQEKQMSFQPDFILEYAHFLQDHFQAKTGQPVSVFVDSFVALNGRLSQQFIDPDQDLTKIKRGYDNKFWILPFNDRIDGF